MHDTPTTPARTTSGHTRRVRTWVPLAVSIGLHGALAVVLVAMLVGPSVPEERVAAFRSIAFVEPCMERSCEPEPETLPEEEPSDELELHPLEMPATDAPMEAHDLPEVEDAPVADMPTLEAHTIPLTAVKPRRVETPEAVRTPARPRRTTAQPVSRPSQNRTRPQARLKLVSRPSLMRYYPEEARRRGVEGEALVEILVDAEGRVTQATLVRSSGSTVLDRQAIRVMYDYRFAPGAGGRARVPVTFRLR